MCFRKLYLSKSRRVLVEGRREHCMPEAGKPTSEAWQAREVHFNTSTIKYVLPLYSLLALSCPLVLGILQSALHLGQARPSFQSDDTTSKSINAQLNMSKQSMPTSMAWYLAEVGHRRAIRRNVVTDGNLIDDESRSPKATLLRLDRRSPFKSPSRRRNTHHNRSTNRTTVCQAPSSPLNNTRTDRSIRQLIQHQQIKIAQNWIQR